MDENEQSTSGVRTGIFSSRRLGVIKSPARQFRGRAWASASPAPPAPGPRPAWTVLVRHPVIKGGKWAGEGGSGKTGALALGRPEFECLLRPQVVV